ncbi:beta 1-4 rhamnosyltransferase Cps2T [Sporolactobacillus terrae]|uniref:beta 1-4 rhamnosyltransferase Cps2T n=1 Tax=Sporolactobacillus terrae TaxID=269673 RepID=UPI001118016F|nr:DUF1972 domain-containing protein [Sporolactobacillus terrae]
MVDIFIIGSKGIPANYGGFETFVEQLTVRRINKEIKYHVTCLSDNNNEFYYNGVHCFNIDVWNIGSGKAVLYDIFSIKRCIEYIKLNNLKNCIVYVLACRIGPMIAHYKKELSHYGAKLYVNPDGHEWKRSKWSKPIQKYWKISEKLMVKSADLLICDSKGIERYILDQYSQYHPKTTFIPYGADIEKSKDMIENKFNVWLEKNSLKCGNYFLIVGRFVPENNYELMIKEFMNSNTNKDLVIISNVKENAFYKKLLVLTNFKTDSRIKFVGTVYDKELLKKIREMAYGYIHGHEVGGTNPSLLEAMSTTAINLLLDVVFNKEVGKDGALYFNKHLGNLSKLIDQVDHLSKETVSLLQVKAKSQIYKNYSWDKVINSYELLFLSKK